MMYGLGETLAERLEHLQRVKKYSRALVEFTAFICWPLQPENTPTMSHQPKTGRDRVLRTVAFARRRPRQRPESPVELGGDGNEDWTNPASFSAATTSAR